MKVNIIGNGTIPLIGLTAPIRNLDLEETKIRALVNVKSLRIYNTESGILITPRNVNGIFAVPVNEDEIKQEESPVVEEVKPAEEIVTETEESASVTQETSEEENIGKEIDNEETASSTTDENVANNSSNKKKHRKK